MSSQLLFPGLGLPGNRSSVQAVHLAAKKTSRVSFWRSAVTTSCQKTRKLPTSAPAQRTTAQTRKLIVIVKLLQRVFMSRNKGKGLASRWVSPRRPNPGILRCPIAPVIFCSQLAVQRLQCSGLRWPARVTGTTGQQQQDRVLPILWMMPTMIILL